MKLKQQQQQVMMIADWAYTAAECPAVQSVCPFQDGSNPTERFKILKPETFSDQFFWISYIKFVDQRIFWLWNCEMIGRVSCS